MTIAKIRLHCILKTNSIPIINQDKLSAQDVSIFFYVPKSNEWKQSMQDVSENLWSYIWLFKKVFEGYRTWHFLRISTFSFYYLGKSFEKQLCSSFFGSCLGKVNPNPEKKLYCFCYTVSKIILESKVSLKEDFLKDT